MQMYDLQDVTHRFISIAYTLERHKKEAEWSSKMTKTLEFHLGTSLGFPCGLAGKESTCRAGDLDSIPGLGRYPGLENSMDCTAQELDTTELLSLFTRIQKEIF